MKQYLTPEQTAKLIELGFEKLSKKGLLFQSNIENCHTDLMVAEENYSLGELIEMLPKVIDCDYDAYNLQIEAGSNWKVCYVKNGMIEDDCGSSELIDALYEMIVKLKDKKVL